MDDLNIQQQYIDLKNAKTVVCESTSCNGILFENALILKKISKFLVSSPEDKIATIPVLVCKKCGEIQKKLFPDQDIFEDDDSASLLG